MGWTYSREWTKPADIKSEILGQLTRSGWTVLDTAATAYGKRLWFAVEHPEHGKSVLLVRTDGGPSGWGYKTDPERCGPVETDCPLRLLAITDPGDPSEHAPAWRKAVRAQAMARTKRRTHPWKPGDVVRLVGGRAESYTLARPYTKSSWVGYADDGAGPFRLPTAKLVPYAEYVAARDAHIADVLTQPYRGICAWGSWHENVPPGFVGVCATPGGNREGIGVERYVLVPKSSYDARDPLTGYALTGDEFPWSGANSTSKEVSL